MKAGTKLIGAVGVAGWLAFAGTHPAVVHAVLTDIPTGTPTNVALGQRMAAALPYGWTGSQWACLDTLWAGESGWRTNADTEASGLTAPGQPYAYGIPQAYPGQKMATAGADWKTSPATQIRWGLRYVASVYGTPCSALTAKRENGNKGY